MLPLRTPLRREQTRQQYTGIRLVGRLRKREAPSTVQYPAVCLLRVDDVVNDACRAAVVDLFLANTFQEGQVFVVEAKLMKQRGV